MTSQREETFTSPFVHSPARDHYGEDSFHQHGLVEKAVKWYFEDPFEKGVDLRGRKFTIEVHEDGLNVTISEAMEPTSGGDEDRHRYCDPDRHRCWD